MFKALERIDRYIILNGLLQVSQLMLKFATIETILSLSHHLILKAICFLWPGNHIFFEQNKWQLCEGHQRVDIIYQT